MLARVVAEPVAIGAAWQAVYAMALPRAYTCDFDVHYGDGERAGTVDVYVAVRH